MEPTVEVEDDVFFADLSKRISLLIMDDDDDSLHENFPSVTSQAFTQAIHPATQMPVLHQKTCTRECKGTGVFIPLSSHQRRKNRQEKHIKFHRHSDISRGLPDVAYNRNNNNTPNDSLNPRRF
ncbi:uncharacterized protein LOC111369211 [Olea europaea var. sylvestris]|uniref:uncharacterized protein LOC111369211 n=1 Tax=Olea europaea var. sylvestris TaxID=158386 RepID=UPI000C1CFBA5|nr:uncharacterized protein LOC111369211 [Olea europaea var. sylvestris]